MQDNGSGSFVDFAGFDTHEAVLDMIDASNAIFSPEPVQCFNEKHAIRLFTVKRQGYAMLKHDLHIGGLDVPEFIRIRRPAIDFFGWFGPGVFQDAALDATPPQVLVNGVGTLVVPCHAPLAYWSDDLQIGSQGVD